MFRCAKVGRLDRSLARACDAWIIRRNLGDDIVDLGST